MNEWGASVQPFVFVIDFDFQKPLIYEASSSEKICWKTPKSSNYSSRKFEKEPVKWDIFPVSFEHYQLAFNKIQEHIHNGDTYLLNLTMPTGLETNLSPEMIFHLSKAPYKIWLKDEFVCFSPEIFITINDGIISSFPMKGTIDANIDNASQILMNDEKEVAEHHTIVDLIRNDLSMVASEVKVDRLMYLDKISTNRGEILQMSSQISGKLPKNYARSIGKIVSQLLPAGSICGAPKTKTVEIIRSTEMKDRGYYTGIFGYFDGKNLDSCVLIRYIEQETDRLIFRSGGGITFMSDCRAEYEEMIQKVYVPIS